MSGTPAGLERPIPRPDAISQGFWEAAGRGELAVQRCPDCANYQHPPRPICHACGCEAPGYVRVSGEARLVSWVTTYHNVLPNFAPALPYSNLVVELVEQKQLLMLSDLVGRVHDPASLRLGMKMRVIFPAPEGAAPVLPQFEPVLEELA
jgi:uncharacterized OB-fold protein